MVNLQANSTLRSDEENKHQVSEPHTSAGQGEINMTLFFSS